MLPVIKMNKKEATAIIKGMGKGPVANSKVVLLQRFLDIRGWITDKAIYSANVKLGYITN